MAANTAQDNKKMFNFSGLQSVGKAFNYGFQYGIGDGTRTLINSFKGTANNPMTFGRALNNVGAIGIGAGIGASIGASSTVMSGGQVDPATGAAVGAVVGGLAIPAAGFAVGTIGRGGAALLPKLPAIGKSVATGVGKAVAASSPYVLGTGAALVSTLADDVWKVGSRLVSFDSAAEAFNKVKLTGPISGFKAGLERGTTPLSKAGNAVGGALLNGKTLMALSAGVEGFKKAWNTLETNKMGTMMGITTLTPQVPNYGGGYDNAGATGDLVFALNANRRG